MINKKLINFKTKAQFTAKLSQIDRTSIVFIEDTKEIWTHGVFYGLSDGNDHNHDLRYLKLIGGTLTGDLTAPKFISSISGKSVEMLANAAYGKIQTRGSIPLLINDEGNNVAIGKTTAIEKLDINGNVLATGYKKSGSSDSYVLLGGGGHKLITDFTNGFVKYDDVVMNTNPFGGKRLYINSINNALYSAYKRFTCKATQYDSDDSNPVDVTASLSVIFNGDYERGLRISAGKKVVIEMDFNGRWSGYPYGLFLLSFYHTENPSTVTGRIYNNYEPHTIGWHNLNFTKSPGSSSSATIYQARQEKYGMTKLEITITAQSSIACCTTQIDYSLDRPTLKDSSALTQFGPITTYHNFTSTENIIAKSFIKTGSDNTVVLLGGGGQKAISDFSASNHNHNSLYAPISHSNITSGNPHGVNYSNILGAVPTWNQNTTGNAATATTASSVLRATFGDVDNGTHDANSINSNGLWYYSSNGPSTTIGASTNDGAIYSQAYSTSWVGQIAQDYRNGGIYVRGKNNGTWQSWQTVLDSRNYNNYTVTKTGGGASGSWNINAATVTNGVYTNNAQNITAKKTFSVQQAFTAAQGTAPFTVTSNTKVTNLNADLLDGLDSTSFNRTVNITNTSNDYTNFVILLCELTNTNTSANYFCGGSIHLKRANILTNQIQKIDVYVGKDYNKELPVFILRATNSQNKPKPVIVTYNGTKYAALDFNITGSSYDAGGYFYGNASNLGVIQGIKYKNNKTGDIINSEINSSITKATSYLGTTFYGTPQVSVDGESFHNIWSAQNFNPDLKANLVSPSFTGTPTAPTAAAKTNTTQIATTAFVRKEVSDLVGGAPETLDTLKEIADYLTNGSIAGGIVDQLGKKVNKAGDTMTDSLLIKKGRSFDPNVIGFNIGNLHLVTNDTTADYISSITFSGQPNSVSQAQAGIYVQGSGSYGTKMYFATTNSHATGPIKAMVIDHLGNNWVKGTLNAIGGLQVNGQNVWHSGNLTGNQTGHVHNQYYDSNLNRTKNTILAAPNGTDGKATFRTLVAADLPSHNHNIDVLYATDKRDVKPNTTGITNNVKAIKSFFTATSSLGISGYGTYADLLMLDTYSDSSGGNPNAIAFMKNTSTCEMFIGKSDFNGASWGTFNRVWHSGNFNPNDKLNLTGGTLSGLLTIAKSTVGALTIERTGSANAATIQFKNSNGELGAIGMSGAANGSLIRWTTGYGANYTIWDASNSNLSTTNWNSNKLLTKTLQLRHPTGESDGGTISYVAGTEGICIDATQLPDGYKYITLKGASNGIKLLNSVSITGNVSASNLWNTIVIEKTLQVTSEWMDTGIVFDAATIPSGTGSYMISVTEPNYVAGAGGYFNTHTGYCSIYTAASNNAGVSDEILLHKGGHAGNDAIYLRTVLQANPGCTKLQIAASKGWTASNKLVFKFRRVM